MLRDRAVLHRLRLYAHQLGVLIVRSRPNAELRAEVLALRHQLGSSLLPPDRSPSAAPPLPAAGASRSQRSWREFVRQHADQILATDFFVVDTFWLTRL